MSILRNFRRLLLLWGLILMAACQPGKAPTERPAADGGVVAVGAMRHVMREGKLGGIIRLDTLPREGLHGLGPLSYLRGEILILDGRAYVSRVSSDTTMTVEETFAVEAPFFVYSHVAAWDTLALPAAVTDLPSLEAFLSEREATAPFAFRLRGRVDSALIHVQNLPEGSRVSSPAEAHRGQVRYRLRDTPAEVVGFFSTAHQGVFTHHDAYVHLHLLTADGTQMGHLDEIAFGESTTLYLPAVE